MSRSFLIKSLLLIAALAAVPSAARAEDWDDYMHWPYKAPQNPGNGFQYRPLYDGWYLYPREQRIVPQIQGPMYRNYYGGNRSLGHRFRNFGHDLNHQPYYQGYHFALDVF